MTKHQAVGVFTIASLLALHQWTRVDQEPCAYLAVVRSSHCCKAVDPLLGLLSLCSAVVDETREWRQPTADNEDQCGAVLV